MWYVYVLVCKDGYYHGCTDDLKSRSERHKKGYVPATKDRRPLGLKSYVAFQDKYRAFEFEKYLNPAPAERLSKDTFLSIIQEFDEAPSSNG